MKTSRKQSSGAITVIGAGTMGEAILRGMMRAEICPPERLSGTLRNEERAADLSRALGIRIGVDNRAAVLEADTVIVCLKPQMVLRTLRQLRGEGAVRADQLYVSIAAGVSNKELESALELPCAVLRAMPNTPCAIGRGTTVLSPGARAERLHLDLAHRIFDSLGATLELEEKHLNTVTGLSGSGPAFGYIMIESLADGGVMMGLPRSVATLLAARTLLGAAEMVLATGRHPAALKDDVTTPAGCTIAGILALEDGKIRSTLARGVERAARQAAELGHLKDD